MFLTKKKKIVGRHFILTDLDKKNFTTSINKIIGQLESLKEDVINDNTCDESLTQILSVKGGVSKIGVDLVGKGVLECMQDYTPEELQLIIKNLFKLT